MKKLSNHTLKGMVLTVLLLAGCGIEPLNHTLKGVVSKKVVVENTNRSDTMLQGMTRKMMVYKQDDIIKTELRNTKQEVDKAYSDYISDGYVIYDVVAEGGFANLAGKTPGKYICVWKGADPVGTYAIISACISPHIDVVILGIKINSSNAIEEIDIDVNLGFFTPSGDFSKVLLQYMYWYDKTYTVLTAGTDYVEKMRVKNCKIAAVFMGYALGASVALYRNIELNNCYLNVQSVAGVIGYYIEYTQNVSIGNCYFDIPSSSYALMVNINNCTLNFQNIQINNLDLYLINTGGTAHCNMQNVFFSNKFSSLNTVTASDMTKRILNTIDGYAFVFSGGNLENYIIKTVATTNGFIVGKYEIDFTAINFANFLDLTADWSHDNIDDTNYVVGYQHLDYYNAVFLNNYELPDELKKFSKDYLFVVKRDDFDADLLNATGGAFKIKNFTLYENDGTTLADFQAMENFLIKATDGTDTVVFLYMDNVLYGTIFTDIWDDTIYTITQCFQLWKVDQAQGIGNLIKQYNNPKANPKSPLGGNVRWNNWDNEVRVKQ